MTREEAQEYAKTMSYKEAVLNCIHSKGIAYRKASLIKLRELAEIADKLERDNDMTKEEAIDRLMWLKDVPHINDDKWIEAIDMAIEALTANAVQGEWVDVENEPYCECSVCGAYIDNLDDDYAFCPRCGARMYKGGDTE